MNLSGNTILITGGGSGIGRALAHRLHDLGNYVIVAGRRQAALDEAIAGRARMTAMVLDLENTQMIKKFAVRASSDHPALNMLINNAGIMRFENLTASRDLSDVDATITTNLLGPIRLTNALIEHLIAQADAAIINVTSGLAFVPLAITPTYSATKAALHSYTISLRQQLKDKVEVVELAPPAVQTDLTPGRATPEGFMPLDTFVDEVLALFEQKPTPSEILVEEVRLLRDAEARGQFDQVLATLNKKR